MLERFTEQRILTSKEVEIQGVLRQALSLEGLQNTTFKPERVLIRKFRAPEEYEVVSERYAFLLAHEYAQELLEAGRSSRHKSSISIAQNQIDRFCEKLGDYNFFLDVVNEVVGNNRRIRVDTKLYTYVVGAGIIYRKKGNLSLTESRIISFIMYHIMKQIGLVFNTKRIAQVHQDTHTEEDMVDQLFHSVLRDKINKAIRDCITEKLSHNPLQGYVDTASLAKGIMDVFDVLVVGLRSLTTIAFAFNSVLYRIFSVGVDRNRLTAEQLTRFESDVKFRKLMSTVQLQDLSMRNNRSSAVGAPDLWSFYDDLVYSAISSSDSLEWLTAAEIVSRYRLRVIRNGSFRKGVLINKEFNCTKNMPIIAHQNKHDYNGETLFYYTKTRDLGILEDFANQIARIQPVNELDALYEYASRSVQLNSEPFILNGIGIESESELAIGIALADSVMVKYDPSSTSAAYIFTAEINEDVRIDDLLSKNVTRKGANEANQVLLQGSRLIRTMSPVDIIFVKADDKQSFQSVDVSELEHKIDFLYTDYMSDIANYVKLNADINYPVVIDLQANYKISLIRQVNWRDLTMIPISSSLIMFNASILRNNLMKAFIISSAVDKYDNRINAESTGTGWVTLKSSLITSVVSELFKTNLVRSIAENLLMNTWEENPALTSGTFRSVYNDIASAISDKYLQISFREAAVEFLIWFLGGSEDNILQARSCFAKCRDYITFANIVDENTLRKANDII